MKITDEAIDRAMDVLAGAVVRACKTLGVAQVALLSAAEEEKISACAYALAGSQGNCGADMVRSLVGIIRKRFPKPAPAARTNEELTDEIQSCGGAGITKPLAELVRRANGAKP